MPNPTRQEIIDAYDSVEELKRAALKSADFCGDTDHFLMCKDEILKVLPPKPRPTMDEVEWDDELHYLAEAEHPNFGKVIMLRLNAHNLIDFIAPECYASRFKDTSPENLTPTGRKFALTEVQE